MFFTLNVEVVLAEGVCIYGGDDAQVNLEDSEAEESKNRTKLEVAEEDLRTADDAY